MLRETLSAARDLGRLHEIASVLIRWGFGDMVQRLGMSHVLERAGRVLRWKDVHALAESQPPQRVVKALEELGPTFVKLGQVLATRVDMFDPVWIEAFERLQDEVAPLPYSAIVDQLKEDIGDDPENIFLDFEKEAFAAASIAQVHRAKLQNGTRVVLKIRRPGIVERIDADLRLLGRLAEIAENNVAELKPFAPMEIVRQFSQSLYREIDFETEARNAERIGANMVDLSYIHIPTVYWEWIKPRLLTQEYIDGIRGRNIEAIRSEGYDLKLLAQRGAHAILKMVVIDGFFHADPHLGNFICLPGNNVAFIDFGMVGRLPEDRRYQLVDLMYALVSKHASGVVQVLVKWAHGKIENEEGLKAEVEIFLDQYHGLPLEQIDFADFLKDLLRVLRTFHVVLPPDLALLFKAFLTLEGVGRKLDPEFNIVDEAAPFLTQVIRMRHAPSALIKRGLRQSTETISAMADLPVEARDFVRALKRGGIKVNIDMTRLDHFGQQIDRAVSRLTIGIVIASLIVGTAIMSVTQSDKTLLGLPIWGFVGFVAAAFGGVWLLISIWRGGRGR